MNELQEWIVAGAAVVGGIGSAAGGIFAWRAAVASGRTAREARDALAHAIAPDPKVELHVFATDDATPSAGDVSVFARVINLDRWPAASLELRVRFADGEPVARRRDQLDPFAPDGPTWWEPLRAVTSEWPPAEPEPIEVTLRYADSRDLTRYEQAMTATLRSTGASGSYAVAIENERLFARRETR